MVDNEMGQAAFLTFLFIIGCIGLYALSIVLYILLTEYLLGTILIFLGILTVLTVFFSDYMKIKSER